MPILQSRTYHCQINALVILEGIEQTNEPLALCISQDITLSENMSDLVQLEEQLLAHHLQSTDFPGILLLRQENLSISTLSNLCEDLEVTLPKTNPTLSEIGALSTTYFDQTGYKFLVGCRRFGEFGFEVIETVLASADVGQEIEVVIQEICTVLDQK